MTENDTLPPIPLRPVATALPQAWIDEIDTLRRLDPDLPSRSEIIRQAVEFYLSMHKLPGELMDALATGCAALESILTETDETATDAIGVMKGAV